MRRAELVPRLAVAGVIVIVILAVAAAVPLLSPEESATKLSTDEYDPDKVVSEPIAANGAVNVTNTGSNRSGVVVIDNSHLNQLDRTALSPLVEGMTQAGYTVRFHEIGDDLNESLEEADAFVVIEPEMEFDREEVEAVQNFTDEGGRLLLVGEPDRIVISGGILGVSLSTDSNRMTTLGSAYGVAFDTRYLYNLETNDGNYKHVITGPPAEAPVEGVDRATIYTGTRVSVRNGTSLLVTNRGTHLSDGGSAGQYTVAAQRENVLAVGDRTFLESNYYSVADNEAFVEYIVRFLLGETPPQTDEGEE